MLKPTPHSNRSAFAAILLTAALARPADAAIYYVSDAAGNDANTGLCPLLFAGTCGPKKTIQSALTAAVSGDTVLVADGTYAGAGNVNLDFAGKGLTLRALGGPANCTINGGGTSRGFTFDNAETASAIVCGFTVTNGSGNGAAIFCTGASPTITHCIIGGNTSFNLCGGIYLLNGSNSLVVNCLIAGNWAEDVGGGILVTNSSPTIRNCLIMNNEASKVYGGGLYCGGAGSATATVSGCTFGGNIAGFLGGAVNAATGGTVNLSNCIVWGNTAPELDTTLGGTITATYCDITGGFAGVGNINANPMYVDPDGPDNSAATWQDNNYHIAAGSPCINVGNPAYAPLPLESDIDGQRRVWAGRIDMGADERGSFPFGDLNCSGRVNGPDIGPFVLALTNPAGYAAAFPACSPLNGDCNGDGSVTTADIPIFVRILLGQQDC